MGQSERNLGRLLSAKSAFLSCASDSCPGEIQSDCAQFLAETEADTPSVVFAASDARGHDTAEVKVSLDGALMTENLSGRAMALDPGNHVVLCTWPDGFAITQALVITQGEKNRRVELRRPLEKPVEPIAPAAPSPANRASRPAVTYVLAGVGVVALGSFAAFALSGRSAESEVDQCKPYCSQATADKMRRRYLFADLSLGVAVLALGTSGYLFLSAERQSSSGHAASLQAAQVGVRGAF